MVAGNSTRRGRRTTPKPPPPAGSGGKRRAGLKGKGRTLPAAERPWHKAYSGPEPVPARTAWKQEKERRAAAAAGRKPTASTPGGRATGGRELVVGRNPVVEALRARVPATALYLAEGIDADERVRELVRLAGDRRIPVLEVTRAELERLAASARHQGVGLQVPAYRYRPFEELVPADPGPRSLLVALDGVTDPRNLGAVIRSAAAFGAQGLFLPARRAAGVTAAAWRTSAGAAAQLPVARVTNLTRALQACQQAGFQVVGLDADAGDALYPAAPVGSGEDADHPDRDPLLGPLVLVVGSEGRGLSRLVGATCDLRVAIPMAAGVESLNASVAAAVVLAEVARRRRAVGNGVAAAA